MKLKNLLEEFVDSYKWGKRYIEIFRNPTPKEMRSATTEDTIAGQQYIKFVAVLKDKSVYVFGSTAFHDNVVKRLKLKKKQTLFYGTAYKEGNGYIVFNGAGKEWKWLRKYGFKV